MRWIKLAFDALRWADHLDEEGWYRNKRFFVQGVSLTVTALAVFGFELGATPEERLAIAGGVMAIVGLFVDRATKTVGQKIDAAEAQLPEEEKPRRARRVPGSRIKRGKEK
jgi:hypothetical protein